MSRRILTAVVVLCSVLWLAGCATTSNEGRLDAFHEVQPSSILIVPVVNESTDVQASTSVLATLPFELAEKGFYVYPVNTVKTLLEYEGLYEPAQIHNQPPAQMAELFQADAILYVTIKEWTSRYVLLSTTTEVDFEYQLLNVDGTELWTERKELRYTPQNNSSGSPMADLITAAATAAIERAAPTYLPLTREAHDQVFNGYSTGLPPGPYNPKFDKYYMEIP